MDQPSKNFDIPLLYIEKTETSDDDDSYQSKTVQKFMGMSFKNYDQNDQTNIVKAQQLIVPNLIGGITVDGDLKLPDDKHAHLKQFPRMKASDT